MAPGNQNAQVTFTANRTGAYEVYANAQAAGMTGAYTLDIVTTNEAGR